ncbi:serine/threonine protein kinase [Ascochyta clinopodiicola]|nr:serine/threonine protein kinase [Ascochyta clinopodiicola]
MNGDLSLSQSLGGLRIANPDEDDAMSPREDSYSQAQSQAPTPNQMPSEEGATYPRPSSPSSPSSSSTVTERQSLQSAAAHSYPLDPDSHPYDAAEPLHSPAPSRGLAPNPYASTPPQSSSPLAHASPLAAVSSSSSSTHSPRLAHRQSMPLAHQAQQQVAYPSYAAAPLMQQRNAPLSQPLAQPLSQAMRDRPVSTSMYNHPNLSTSSTTAPGTYRYNDESMASDIRRTSSSRVAPNTIPVREVSRRDPYRQSAHMAATNGPLPPRRSSRRIPMDGPHAPGMAPQLSSSPYSVEGGPLSSSEEWKEKGAAVSTRQEMDQNGRPITRVVKKGVKDFNFGRTLGEGSYSTVLAATDRQTLREYAIKVLDKRHIIKEKKVKYVNIEKDTLNRLTEHPGVVRLYYTFQDERSLYFVLDLASGGELLGFLKKMGTFDIECTRFYGAQILDAIDYMHSKGIIHRDLKPENVLLDDQMHVKITDFGTAKILDLKNSNGIGSTSGDPMEGAETDRAQSFVGTAEYVSPELLTDKNACKASDLWAFGCIIYQLIAGRPPFKAANEYMTFQKIVGLDYTFPDSFPPLARDLVERLLVLDPLTRLPMEHIKAHPFFDGIVWGKGLWKQKAPRLKAYSPPPQDPIKLNGPSTPGAPAPAQVRPKPRLITELPPPSQLDIDWSPVLTKRDERILKLGNFFITQHPAGHAVGGTAEAVEAPKKFSRFFSSNTIKKRQRLVMITSNARVLMCAAGTNDKKLKEELSLLTAGCSWRSFQDSKGLTAWLVETRDKQYIFEDPKSTTSDPDGSKYSSQEWIDSIEQARDYALSQAPTNDLALSELGSISTPSSLGGDSALDGVNIPASRHGHLHKDRGDTDSVKSRKRFSKRHSKNGLANF